MGSALLCEGTQLNSWVLSQFRSCWNLWKSSSWCWGNHHGAEIVLGHCRVVCARGAEVKLHVGLECWCFPVFSSVLSRCSTRNGFWEELGAPWVLLLLPRVGRLQDGKSFGLIGC